MFYDYHCKDCNKTVEIEKGMNDPTPAKCPECGAENSLERIYSNPVATIYNCNGMYDTDSRKVGSR